MKHQIKTLSTNIVLFECDVSDDVHTSCTAMRHTLEQAVKAGANLDGANLYGVNLEGANLIGANLEGARLIGARLIGANLEGVNLTRANLTGANLIGANLEGAYLTGANLTGTNLTGAIIGGKKLIGERPVFTVGPIGSRCSYFTAYLTDAGVMLRAGCFFGTVDDFMARVSEGHGGNNHAREYSAAIELIRCHAALWTPSAE